MAAVKKTKASTRSFKEYTLKGKQIAVSGIGNDLVDDWVKWFGL